MPNEYEIHGMLRTQTMRLTQLNKGNEISTY